MCVLGPYHSDVSALTRNLFPTLETRRDENVQRYLSAVAEAHFLSYRLRSTQSALCRVPLVTPPDLVNYEWHSDSCVFRCIRDVDMGGLSSESFVSNPFNIAYSEFFRQRGNQSEI